MKTFKIDKFLKKVVRSIYRVYSRYKSERELLKKISKSSSPKIVFGAAGKFDDEWSPTEMSNLNLLDLNDWKKFFQPNSIDAMLAEHVWEHLTHEEASIALKFCFEYLKKGGYFRIAVPDGYHPEQSYIDYVKVNGSGPGADDHKVLYTYKTLKTLLENAGFTAKFLEYYDENGSFQYTEWSIEQGKIYRSKAFDPRNKNNPLSYTSIIVDAYKL